MVLEKLVEDADDDILVVTSVFGVVKTKFSKSSIDIIGLLFCKVLISICVDTFITLIKYAPPAKSPFDNNFSALTECVYPSKSNLKVYEFASHILINLSFEQLAKSPLVSTSQSFTALVCLSKVAVKFFVAKFHILIVLLPL